MEISIGQNRHRSSVSLPTDRLAVRLYLPPPPIPRTMGRAPTKETRVITGELKSKVDKIWDTTWSGGISNPLSVIEQLTYLLFIKRLDELCVEGGPPPDAGR